MTDRQQRYALAALDFYIPFGYASQMLYFPCATPDVDLLRAAFSRLLARFPYLAGTVVPAEGDARPGWLELGAPFVDADAVFSVKDLREQLAYADCFAASESVTPLLSPCWLYALAPAQVLRAQLSVVRGGCALCWMVHHTAVDGAGSARVLRALAALCRGDTSEELQFDRAVPEFYRLTGGESARWADHPEYFEAPPDAPPFSPLPAVQHVLWFSGAALAQLKARCSAPADGDARWVSTNDAMCAFLWTRVAAARVAAGADPARASVFGMSADVRARVAPRVPAAYVGNSTVNLVAASTLAALASAPLRTHALAIRASVTRVTDAHVRDTVALLNGMADIRRWRATQASSETSDFDVTSWAGQGTYALDWGAAFGGAKLERLRFPWNLKQGIAWVMPAGMDVGGLEVVLMLSAEHMEILLRDREFVKYATVVC